MWAAWDGRQREAGEDEPSDHSGCWWMLVDKMLRTSSTCISCRDEAGWSVSQVQPGVKGSRNFKIGRLNLMENGVTLNSGKEREAGSKEKNDWGSQVFLEKFLRLERLCSNSSQNFALLFRHLVCNRRKSRYLLRLPDKIYTITQFNFNFRQTVNTFFSISNPKYWTAHLY